MLAQTISNPSSPTKISALRELSPRVHAGENCAGGPTGHAGRKLQWAPAGHAGCELQWAPRTHAGRELRWARKWEIRARIARRANGACGRELKTGATVIQSTFRIETCLILSRASAAYIRVTV